MRHTYRRPKAADTGEADTGDVRTDTADESPTHYRPPHAPPAIEPLVQLKWGLALLGPERATQYLDWLRTRCEQHT